MFEILYFCNNLNFDMDFLNFLIAKNKIKFIDQ